MNIWQRAEARLRSGADLGLDSPSLAMLASVVRERHSSGFWECVCGCPECIVSGPHEDHDHAGNPVWVEPGSPDWPYATEATMTDDIIEDDTSPDEPGDFPEDVADEDVGEVEEEQEP